MIEQMTLKEFLKFLATANGDAAIEKVSKFQTGGLLIEGLHVEEIEDD